MTTTSQLFVDKWAVASTSNPERGPEDHASLDRVEQSLGVPLPQKYVQFMLEIGGIWTPHILDTVVEKDADLKDLSSILSLEEAEDHTRQWWRVMLPKDLFAFATDASGNMFCFRLSQCTLPRSEDLPVWFFDHDFEEVEMVAPSFERWLKDYIELERVP